MCTWAVGLQLQLGAQLLSAKLHSCHPAMTIPAVLLAIVNQVVATSDFLLVTTFTLLMGGQEGTRETMITAC